MLAYSGKKQILYWRLLRPFLHFLLTVGIFLIIYKVRTFTDLIPFVYIEIPPINFYETFVFSLIAGIAFVFCGFLYGLYELVKPLHGYYKRFLKSWLVWFVIISFLAYFGHGYLFTNGISRLILLWGSLGTLAVLILFDLFWNYINYILESKQPYRLLFVYSDENFHEKVYANFSFYSIYSIQSVEENSFREAIDYFIKDYEVVIFIGQFDINFLQDASDRIRLKDKKFYHISETHFLEDLIYSLERVGPLLAFEYKPSPLEGWFRVGKRIFDIAFSLIFLILFWWVYVIAGVFIYLRDGLPVVYKSLRVGKGKREFRMYKFRTMEKEAEKKKDYLDENNQRNGPLFKMNEDPRIIKGGKFLRKTSIDEMPQIFNVLKGEMSIVGPRPHMPEEVKNYSGWHKRLLSVKPGLTGYAQIFGRDKLDFDEEAKLDLYYIQNRSIGLDIYVILTTVRVLFKGS